MSKKNKGGRPKAVIDWEFVDKALQAHCSGAEISGKLGIHPTTLYNACEREKKMPFSEYATSKKDSGKALLKMSIFKNAMDGNTSAQIWVSKNLLGWTDKQHTKIDSPQAIGFTMLVPRDSDYKPGEDDDVQYLSPEEYEQATKDIPKPRTTKSDD